MPIFRDINDFQLTTPTGEESIQISATQRVKLKDIIALVDLSTIKEAIANIIEDQERQDEEITSNTNSINSHSQTLTNLNNNKKNKVVFKTVTAVSEIRGGEAIEYTGSGDVSCNVLSSTFTSIDNIAWLIVSGNVNVTFSGTDAIYMVTNISELPKGGKWVYRLTKTMQSDKSQIYIDAMAYIPINGTYEILLSASKGMSPSNALGAGVDTANITAELITGDVSSGIKPKLSLSGDGFTLNEEALTVTTTSRGTTIGDVRTAVLTATYDNTDPKSITLYQEANRIKSYDGEITISKAPTYANISGAGGMSEPKGLAYTQEVTYTSGAKGPVNNPGSVSYAIVTPVSGFSIDSVTGRVTASVNPSYTSTRQVTVRMTITSGEVSETRDIVVTQSAQDKSSITLSVSYDPGSKRTTYYSSRELPETLMVQCTFYDTYSTGGTTGEGNDGMQYSFPAGTNELVVNDGPGFTWDTTGRVKILEVNGQRSSPLETPEATYEWDDDLNN